MMISGANLNVIAAQNKQREASAAGDTLSSSANNIFTLQDDNTAKPICSLEVCTPVTNSTVGKEISLNYFQVELRAAQDAATVSEKIADGARKNISEIRVSGDQNMYQYMLNELAQHDSLAAEARAFSIEKTSELSPRIAQLTAEIEAMRSGWNDV